MGKVFKGVHKAVTKVTGSDKLLGEMGLWNVSGKNAQAEAAQKQAVQDAAIMQKGIDNQAANSIEAARSNALAIQSAADRERALLAAQEAQQVTSERPEVAPAADVNEAALRRKRFQSNSVGGSGGGGASIRL